MKLHGESTICLDIHDTRHKKGIDPHPVKLLKSIEGLSSFCDPLTVAQDVKKGKLVVSPTLRKE